MDEIKLQKTEIIGRQILLYFFDFFKVVLPIFDKKGIYRIPFKEYDKFRQKDKIAFAKEMYRLKKHGVIKKYLKDKENYIELTQKGKEYLKRYLTKDLKLKDEYKWDRKWRLVIFDIPEEKKRERDTIRHKLEYFGFFELQKSVYVYPFECRREIEILKSLHFLKPHIQYILADRIETEVNLIDEFIDRGILTDKNTK